MQCHACHGRSTLVSRRSSSIAPRPAAWMACRTPASHARRQQEMQAAAGAPGASKGFGAPPKPKADKPKSEPGPPPAPCPCLSGKAYKNCCEPAHAGARKASSPEAALRARFSAFIKGRAQYITDTTHPDYLAFHYENKSVEEAKQSYSEDIHTACTKFDFEDLKVTKVEAGADPQTEGFVAFTYRSAPKQAEEAAADEQREWKTTNEKGRFLRVDNQWLFTDYQRFEYSMNSLLQEPVKPEPVPKA